MITTWSICKVGEHSLCLPGQPGEYGAAAKPEPPIRTDVADKKLAGSEELLKLYFECVYPYTPILNRVEFLLEYERGTFSPFLMQCVLANSLPYASDRLLREAGFSDRRSAQKIVFDRARLLYDFETEYGQLRLLQGSLILSSLQFAFALDKDFRFWMSNAVRLATQMGLHRDSLGMYLEESSRKLFRRIWWVLYCRDILLVISGCDNARRINDGDFDTVELSEDDWEDESVPPRFAQLVHPITQLQKSYLIQNCKLSRISKFRSSQTRADRATNGLTLWQASKFLQTFMSPGAAPSSFAAKDLEHAIRTWRRSLPDDMRTDSVQDWSSNNVWIFVLMMMSYRLECIFYRTLRERGGPNNSSSTSQAEQRQLSAMLQLDTVMDQLVLNDLAAVCPLSV